MGLLLNEGLSSNKSLKKLSIINCDVSNQAYDLISNGLLSHNFIEFINFSNSNLNDKCSNMICRIITRQSNKKDETIWMYGLRNEVPLNNNFKGLVCIDLSDNKLNEFFADKISFALESDNYIRYLNLSNNLFSENSCKKFVLLLRVNNSLLSVDLRGNPGYKENLHIRITMKLCNNIRAALIQNNKLKSNMSSEINNSCLIKYIDKSLFNVTFIDSLNSLSNNNIEDTNSEIYNQKSRDINNNNNNKIDITSNNKLLKQYCSNKEVLNNKIIDNSVNKLNNNIKEEDENVR